MQRYAKKPCGSLLFCSVVLGRTGRLIADEMELDNKRDRYCATADTHLRVSVFRFRPGFTKATNLLSS